MLLTVHQSTSSVYQKSPLSLWWRWLFLIINKNGLVHVSLQATSFLMVLHLYYCKEFECPSHFKCPESYCIPIRHICDSEQDCPFGEDEENCSILTCSGLFWCPVDKLCLSHIEICDGIIHCPLTKEDELFCNMNSCPKTCFCVGYGVHCIQYVLRQVPIIGRTATTLILRNNLISNIDSLKQY